MKIMMRNRALAIGARMVAPDAFVFGGTTYTVDEVADIQDISYTVQEDGSVTI